MSLDSATTRQNAAANPDNSTWLAANAGSGKTRVLTDRVARLLLRKADPQNILCLTYTKAAAGEMQNRLFANLGAWSMLPDTELAERLEGLGEAGPLDLSRARTLFARAIETPGGLKIQTIHSFCGAILRQFPLEAGVSPGFRELDEPGQNHLLEEVVNTLCLTDPQAVEGVARILGGSDLVELAKDIAGARDGFVPTLDAAASRALFDLPADVTSESVITNALTHDDLRFLKEIAPLFLASEKPTDQKAGAVLAGLGAEPNRAVLQSLIGLLLSGPKANEPFGVKASPPTKELKEGAFVPHLDRYGQIGERVRDARHLIVALDAAEKTAALHRFAAGLLPAYQAAKDARGVLDFDDLIHRTRALLTDRSLAWVLYRLDARIDHILVDEAQDTSPAQWSIISALAEEIASGEGSRADLPRSLFVVGDKKQSIYSFQGADARAFDTMSDRFEQMMTQGGRFERQELPFSFRSSPAILTAVDATFREAGLSGAGDAVAHEAVFSDIPGRVDVWQPVVHPPQSETPEWYHPVDRVADDDPAVLLAEKIARNIAALLKSGTIPEKNGKVRPLTAGDFMILVQRRSTLFHQIIRACKTAGLPVSGADKLKITSSLAVRDLLALLSFLALPEDDLSLAIALRSPLFGWSEADLYALAQGRDAPFLWAELRARRDEWPDTVGMLDALRRKVDFHRPYEMLEMILTQLDGRTRLAARLGPEAEDAIDELLNQALLFEQNEVPTITGFVSEMRSSDIEVKRQLDAESGQIRVMTIHGAKGLESPVVILPETIRSDRSSSRSFVITDSGTPVWNTSEEVAPPLVLAAKDTLSLADREERQRLLYVAMTRAKHWLIVAGIALKKGSADSSWHAAITKGVEAAGGQRITAAGEDILRLQSGDWPESPSDELPGGTGEGRAVAAPSWGDTAPVGAAPERVLSPSDLGGAKIVPGDAGLPVEEAKRRGRWIHALLEHLPAHPQPAWPDIAEAILTRGPEAAPAAQIPALLGEAARTIVAHPELFRDGGLTEADLTAPLGSGTRLAGTVDRLILTDDRVIIVDYKTNAMRPAAADAIPDGVLRQMGAYLAAAHKIWPAREIELIVLWTIDATAMTVPHDIATEAFQRTTSA